jgi:hypothetical protein
MEQFKEQKNYHKPESQKYSQEEMKHSYKTQNQ